MRSSSPLRLALHGLRWVIPGCAGLALFLLWIQSGSVAASEQEVPAVNYFSYFDGFPEDIHTLDDVERFLEEGERLQCSAEDLVRYRSSTLRYSARVHTDFAERLERFDAYVAEVAVEHYGRAPRRVRHRGVYNCRKARGRAGRISEHAFGNAIDVTGFDFRRLRRSESSPEAMPRHARRGFRLTIRRHWKPRRKRDAYHAQFLHRLVEGLRERPDIFRGIVGPPRPRHGDHLHLDASPWRYAMFGYDPIENPQE